MPNATPASALDAPPSATADAPRLVSLRDTAELHGISPSHLSRQVRAGRPAKGYDLTPYVRVGDDGQVAGFALPEGYVPADSRVRSDAAATGDRPSSGDRSSPGGRPARKAGPSPSDAFFAGAPAWGTLQRRRGPAGAEAWHFVAQILEADAMGITAIAAAWGAGTYRLSRWAQGEETERVVHIEFGVDPAAVPRGAATESPSIENPPTESPPVEEPSEDRASENPAPETGTPETDMAETDMAETDMAAVLGTTKLVEVKDVTIKPVEVKPVEVKSIEGKPVEGKPVEGKPEAGSTLPPRARQILEEGLPMLLQTKTDPDEDGR